jgi:hypothetical protein
MRNLADGLAAPLPATDGDPVAMMSLAGLIRKDARAAEALAPCRKAMALAPHDATPCARGRGGRVTGIVQ